MIKTPVSDAWGKDWATARISTLDKVKPISTVFDYGAGVGTYGLMLRPLLPKAQLAAVEVWEPYVETYGLKKIYDSVHIEDLRHVAPRLHAAGELAIFGDVIEHMPKTDSIPVLQNRIHAVFNGLTLVCIPLLHLEQPAVNGNPFEIHRMENHWDHEEMLDALESACRHGNRKGQVPWAIDTHIGPVLGYYLVRQGVYAYERYDMEAEYGATIRKA